MSCSRQVKGRGESESKDRISTLPDCLISHILSCLPTINAVQTSVLSKAWEFKWTSAYNINIDDQRSEGFSNKVDDVSFISYVDRILLLSPNITRFTLTCYKFCDVNRLKTWISAIFMRNVENVSLYVNLYAKLVLRRFLLNCTSLRELKLRVHCTFKVPPRICFPNLISLILSDIKMVNYNSSINTIAFSFPVLETLELSWCTWLEVRFVEIHAPKLRTLQWVSGCYEEEDYIIKILGATLTMFDALGPFPENFIFTGSTVDCAELDFNLEVATTEDAGLRVQMLMSQFSNSIRKLTLSYEIMEVIVESISHNRLPMFNMLRQLNLSGETERWLDVYGINFLFDLLHAAPFLEDLIIDVEYSSDTNSDDEDRDDAVVVLNDAYEVVEDGYDYEEMEDIPSCIVSHLKKVEFMGYGNWPNQFNLAAFLLKNCSQLKEFRVNHATSWMNISKLLAISRASRTVRFFINEE